MTSNYNGKVEECHMKDNFCQAGDTFCENSAPVGWEKCTFISPALADFRREMKNSLKGNEMENFENRMMKEVKMFDKLKRDSDKKNSATEQNQDGVHVPATLNNTGLDLTTLWQRIHSILDDRKSTDDLNIRKANMKSLTPEVYQMLLAHGIGAWLSTLSRDHFERLSLQIYSETSQWISKIWRFRCSASLFHNKHYDGIFNVCKAALVAQFPKYETEGFHALYSRPPVIYLNCAVEPSMIDYVRINLGLPSSSICLVPNSLELCGDESMDMVSLEQLILADTAAGKMPLLVCCYAGSPNTGCMDQLTDIHTLCRTHRIWLHIDGFRLSELALLHVPAKVNMISSKVKSMTLDLGSWLGIPSVPYVTLVMTKVSESYLNSLGFGAGYFWHNNTAMDIFPLWLSLQLIGHDGIVNRIESQTKLNHLIVTRLKEIPSIKLISRTGQTRKKVPQTDNGTTAAQPSVIHSLMDTVLTFLLDGHQVPSVILFRYDPKIVMRGVTGDEVGVNVQCPNGTVLPDSVETVIRKPRFVALHAPSTQNHSVEEEEDSQIYRTSLNQWLADNLISSYPQMSISTIDLPAEGLCLRLCLHEHNIGQDISEDVLDKFFLSINQHVAIMNATVNQRSIFKDIVTTRPQLLHVDLPSWAGLGCVLFVPESYREELLSVLLEPEVDFNNVDFVQFLLRDNHLHEMNNVNRILLDELRSDDEAFSLGLYHFHCDGSEEQACVVCVRFGLVTETTTVDQLIDLVVTKGDQVESSTKNLEMLSRLVKQGIDRVNEELAKDYELKLRQDGVLRQVPYIDSLINWWYPPHKNIIKGRSLNLSSGQIQCTDDIYKHKMQLQHGSQAVFSLTKETNGVNPGGQ